MKKIIAICETTDFQNFTRRATLEAIYKEHPNLQILLCGGWRAFFKGEKSKSKIIPSRFYLYMFPKKMRDILFFRLVSRIIDKIYLGKYFSMFDIVFFLKPSDEFFLPLFQKQKKIFLISDPYHFLSRNSTKTLNREIILYKNSDLTFATSLALQKDYIEKYYHSNIKKTVYWPNTVDLNNWSCKKNIKKDKIVGYAGNLSEVTVDLELLEKIAVNGIKVEIAGKINCKTKSFKSKLNRIIDRNKNITFLGWLTRAELKNRMQKWKVGLLLDPINDISKYIHHNKPYQYFAMGIPVITKDYLPDYKSIPYGMFIANNNNDYIKKLKKIIITTYNIDDLIKIAIENSSTVRGKEFINVLKTNNIL